MSTLAAADLTPPGHGSVPEVECLRLQNLYLQHRLRETEMNALLQQFLSTAQPKALQEQLAALTRDINTLAAKIFADHDLDPERCQFNVNTGMFVERSGPTVTEGDRDVR